MVVSDAIATAKAFEEVEGSLSDVSRDIPRIVESINTVIDMAKEIPDVEYFVNLVVAGNFSKIEDMVEAIQIIQELPRLGKDLQSDVATIVKFVTTFGAQSNQTVVLFQDLLDSSWESYPLEFTTDSSGNVRAGLIEIQNLIRDEISEPLQNVTNSFQAMEDVLSTLPFKNGYFYSKAGVASYQRWSDFSLQMPCLTTGYRTFNFAGLTKKFGYPKFYACDYSGNIIWPNHHIPYIKFRIA